ncbi:hypothetical protein SBA2_60026 [Acidobacteriia bacterium SbA2]|nr:hypothetical protein SBA2_60026 [Acidobacteriia bacterium SbA2]
MLAVRVSIPSVATQAPMGPDLSSRRFQPAGSMPVNRDNPNGVDLCGVSLCQRTRRSVITSSSPPRTASPSSGRSLVKTFSDISGAY